MQSLIALPSSIAVVQRLNNCLVLGLRWKPRGIVHHSLFFVKERKREEKERKNRWNLNSLGQLFRVKKVALWTQEMKEWFSQIWINCRFIVLGLRKKEKSRKTWINLNWCVTLTVILSSERTMPFICTITIYTSCSGIMRHRRLLKVILHMGTRAPRYIW